MFTSLDILLKINELVHNIFNLTRAIILGVRAGTELEEGLLSSGRPSQAVFSKCQTSGAVPGVMLSLV